MTDDRPVSDTKADQPSAAAPGGERDAFAPLSGADALVRLKATADGLSGESLPVTRPRWMPTVRNRLWPSVRRPGVVLISVKRPPFAGCRFT